MRTTVHSFHTWMIFATAAALGCSSKSDEPRLPIDASSAALTAQQNTEAVLNGVLEAGDFLADSAAVAQSLSQLGSGEATGCAAGSATVADDCDPSVEECGVITFEDGDCVDETNEVTPEDLEQTRAEIAEGIGELVAWLRDEALTEANLESDDGEEVVYRLGADVLCTEGPVGSDDSRLATVGSDVGNPEPPVIDEECRETIEKLEPRLRLTSPSEGDIDIALLLTSREMSPVTFQLYDDRLGVVVDLGEIRELLEAADEVPEGLDELDGVTSVEFVKNGERDYSLRSNVLEEVVMTAGEEGEKTTIRVAPSSPAAELRLDGNARTITGSYDMSTLQMTLPLEAFRGDGDDEPLPNDGSVTPQQPYTGLIHLLLGGLSGSLTFDGTTDVLTLSNLGLGDTTTTVHHDDDLIFSLDVNPDQDRRFDLQIQSGSEGDPILTFSPTLDVQMQFAMQHIADQIPDLDSPIWNDSVRLWFEGTNPAIQGHGDALRVVSGTLHVDSANTPASSVAVEEGMCLLDSSVEEEQATSLSAAFVAGVCE